MRIWETDKLIALQRTLDPMVNISAVGFPVYLVLQENHFTMLLVWLSYQSVPVRVT